MTDVIVAPRVENLTSDTESVVTGGWFRIRPSARYVSGGQWVHPVWPASPTPLVGSAVTVKLDPLPTIPYEIEIEMPDGDGGRYRHNEYRIIAASGSPVTWESQELVTGPAAEEVPTNTVQAAIDALWAALGAVSGGATTLAGITDMSAFMRTVNDDTSASAARTTLGVPAIGDAPTAHTHIATTGLTATGTKNSTTFLRGDDTWATPPAAGSPAWGDITGKPTTFAPTTHNHAYTDITGLSADVVSLLECANVAEMVALLSAVTTADEITISQLPAGSVLLAQGAATPRPTARTDLSVLWTAASAPSNAVADVDLWFNGPDA